MTATDSEIVRRAGVPIYPTRAGMKTSVVGVLTRAAPLYKRLCKGLPIGYDVVFVELAENLQTMADAFYRGDNDKIDEFLQLYALDRERITSKKNYG